GVAAHENLTAPGTDLFVLEATPNVPPPEDFVETVLVLESNTGKPKAIPKSKWAPGTPLAMGVRDRAKPGDCKININGDAQKLGEPVARGFLKACRFNGDSSSSGEALEIDPQQSGRLQLARWLTHEQHPLTARVMVNRVWSHLFGDGIVGTPDDFGVYGEAPTHPQLLDHLATRFRADGWSMKRLIRSIVLSRAYQLSSLASAEQFQRDPENRWLARHRRRRLDAESLRDSMLLVAGQLDLAPGDGSLIRHRDILVNLAGNLHEPSNHRSVYLCYLRNSPPPELAAFDLPDFTTTIGRRHVSTQPRQALHLFNNPFVIEQARLLAAQVVDAASDDYQRVRCAYQRALGRDPAAEETQQAVELVHDISAVTKSADGAWGGFCQALFMSNEFRYVD
ncbi:MAG: DUF1553 domain-containing protein, partial [Planctomycetales bacterium]|nr:DUF1553 domain-containing protein [Planctomycetales bacterium]